jgi:hypothetical protein
MSPFDIFPRDLPPLEIFFRDFDLPKILISLFSSGGTPLKIGRGLHMGGPSRLTRIYTV